MKTTDLINHADREHAEISPSAVSRTVKCPGWIEYCKDIVTIQSPAAWEGTLAHQIAEELGLFEFGVKKTLLVDTEKYDADMIFYGTNYAKFLKRMWKRFDGDTFHFEERVYFSDKIWGTADFYGMKTIERAVSFDLIMIDYKYGKGVEVDAEDNSQLKTYVAAAARGIKGKLRKAFVFIYQPRVGEHPYSHAVYTGEDIETWSVMLEQLEEDVSTIKYGDGLNAQGLDHCRFCPGKVQCPAFLQEVEENALTVLDDAPDFEPPKAQDIPLEDLVKILTRKKAIEHFLNDVESHLMRKLEAGEEVPGYKLVNGRSMRKWTDDKEMVATNLRRMGVEEPYRQSLITLGEAEKALGGGKSAKSAIEPLIEYTTPKKQIAPESDKRKAIDVAEDAAKVLTVLNE